MKKKSKFPKENCAISNPTLHPLIWPVVGNPLARRRVITRPLRSFEGCPAPFVLLRSSGDTLRGRFSHASVSRARLHHSPPPPPPRASGSRGRGSEKRKGEGKGQAERRRGSKASKGGNEMERSVARLRREMNVRTRLTFSLVRVDFYRMQAAKHCAPNL